MTQEFGDLSSGDVEQMQSGPSLEYDSPLIRRPTLRITAIVANFLRFPTIGRDKVGCPAIILVPLVCDPRSVSGNMQKRVEALAQRANKGVLTEAERANYEALINAADFIAILKLKAQRKLTSNG